MRRLLVLLPLLLTVVCVANTGVQSCVQLPCNASMTMGWLVIVASSPLKQ